VNFGLHWLSLSSGRSLLAYNAVRYLAFVAAPPLLMVLLLTTRPSQGLSLRWPPCWAWPAGAALAVLLLPPFSALTLLLLDQFPQIKEVAAGSLAGGVSSLRGEGVPPAFAQAVNLLVFVVLPAVCEELAFRGFILSGLGRRFRPWAAILLSSFLYALYQMNVLQALPHFLLGLVLAMLVLRGGSLAGAIVFRLVWEFLLWSPLLLQDGFSLANWLNPGIVLACLLLATPLLAFLRPASTEKRNPSTELQQDRPVESSPGPYAPTA
jgi:sodium transport system permease protein